MSSPVVTWIYPGTPGPLPRPGLRTSCNHLSLLNKLFYSTFRTELYSTVLLIVLFVGEFYIGKEICVHVLIQL